VPCARSAKSSHPPQAAEAGPCVRLTRPMYVPQFSEHGSRECAGHLAYSGGCIQKKVEQGVGSYWNPARRSRLRDCRSCRRRKRSAREVSRPVALRPRGSELGHTGCSMPDQRLITSLCGSIQTDGTAYEPEARRVNRAKRSPVVVGRGELKNESWHALKSGTPTTVPPHQRKSPARSGASW
jgi:hypothetical protein